MGCHELRVWKRWFHQPQSQVLSQPGRTPPLPVQTAPAALKCTRVFSKKCNLALNGRNVCGVLAGTVLCSALFHTLTQKVSFVIEKSYRLREQACDLESVQGPWGSQVVLWSGARACQVTQQDQGNFYFLSPSLPIKQLNEINGNQVSPSKHFSGFNSILHWAVKPLRFSSWRAALIGEACLGFFPWGFFSARFIF